MFVRFRKYVLLALMLMVPLQGLASTLHALSCLEHDAPAAAASDHTHADGDHGAVHHHPDESNGGGADHNAHQCCQHGSAAPVYVSTGDRSDGPVFQSSAIPLARSVVLERPQRPPRA